jgi:hypothetical protein
VLFKRPEQTTYDLLHGGGGGDDDDAMKTYGGVEV